jgi:hypothetical protein
MVNPDYAYPNIPISGLNIHNYNKWPLYFHNYSYKFICILRYININNLI